jgi:hypothetical protein
VSGYGCCVASSGSGRVAGGARHWRESVRWIIPSGILVLLPKCPACLVAYIAIVGGIGISVTTAMYVRWGVVILCIGSLAYFAVSLGRRMMARSLHSTVAPVGVVEKAVNSQVVHDRG